MFKELFNKLSTFGEHHQIIVTLVIALGIICVSWGIERILEDYIFPHKPLYGYLATIIGGLLLLWLVKHYILHVV